MATVEVHPDRAPGVIWRDRELREVSIVIPAFRNVPYLPAAIESALHAPVAMVLIADDGCGVAEREVFERFEAEHRARLRVIRSDTQRGIATNLNEAIRRVRTPYFVRLDSDDVLYPGHVEAAFRLLAERPGLAAVAGREQRITCDDHLAFHPSQLPPYRPDPDPRIVSGPEAFRFSLAWKPNPCSSGTMFRLAAFREIGGFDLDVPWGEDWEIWFRLARHWALAYLDAPAALYRIHSGATTLLHARENRLCYSYDFMVRRAAEVCPYPELNPQIRRAFVRVARLYSGAAMRQALRLQWKSVACCGMAARAGQGHHKSPWVDPQALLGIDRLESRFTPRDLFAPAVDSAARGSSETPFDCAPTRLQNCHIPNRNSPVVCTYTYELQGVSAQPRP